MVVRRVAGTTRADEDVDRSGTVWLHSLVLNTRSTGAKVAGIQKIFSKVHANQQIPSSI